MRQTASCGIGHGFESGGQHHAENAGAAANSELARLRTERDAAVAESHARLWCERNAAVAAAEDASSRLEQLQRQHAALRETHGLAVLKAQQDAERSAAQATAATRSLECLQASHATLEASQASKALRIEALEAKLSMVLSCYMELEAGHRCRASHTGYMASMPAQCPIPGLTCAPMGSLSLDGPGCHPVTAAALAHGIIEEEAEADSLSQPTLPRCSHMGLALRCADLSFRLHRQQQATAAARKAAEAAEEQAAGLRLLLSRGQAASKGAPRLEKRIEGACCQLKEAQAVGAELRQQLEQARTATRPLPSSCHALPTLIAHDALHHTLQMASSLSLALREKALLQQNMLPVKH